MKNSITQEKINKEMNKDKKAIAFIGEDNDMSTYTYKIIIF